MYLIKPYHLMQMGTLKVRKFEGEEYSNEIILFFF